VLKYDDAIDVLKQEVEWYANKNHPDWSQDKNNGFREGIKVMLQSLELTKTAARKSNWYKV